ncbi:N-carbamoyl-L-amino-acid hydrolase [Advenella incenata]|jgi:N-carbamoyl-L-amino-acid hydrolase|uniref:N-carbamoyl-L-amino-acid hydrolase n=1 Tax=Advenella incenata TaxID=267800 RepID=A0A4Q7VU84_9BURK|nr:Zn-dependent hydrolase [Advenella incenata]RZU00184.1 N-carbamoyl-L-amino-acid hydrolase [Advenella incenata]
MMKANQQRYWDALMELGAITDAALPYTRRSFSETFLEGRQWISERMQQLGMVVHVDAAGNLVGRLAGTDKNGAVIAVGSHSDTVPGGGRFDGVAGVVAGLECVASLQERNIKLNHTLEVIDFLAEEPSEWGQSCIGSRGISGHLSEDILRCPHPQTAELLADAIVRMGGRPNALVKRDDIKAFFEIHIEQGCVLENEALPIGVVSAIVGIIRVRIKFKGQAAHAGTTPMHMRSDALLAAAQTACDIRQFAAQMASDKPEHYVVATCGQFNVKPNASNVVPGFAEISVEMRSDHRPSMEALHRQLEQIAAQAAAMNQVTLLSCETVTDTQPVVCAPQLMAHIRDASDSLGLPYKVMPSGAGHDAAFLSHISPSAMIFVPSKGGKSHCAHEWTSAEELTQGISVLIDAIERFDGSAKKLKQSA